MIVFPSSKSPKSSEPTATYHDIKINPHTFSAPNTESLLSYPYTQVISQNHVVINRPHQYLNQTSLESQTPFLIILGSRFPPNNILAKKPGSVSARLDQAEPIQTTAIQSRLATHVEEGPGVGSFHFDFRTLCGVRKRPSVHRCGENAASHALNSAHPCPRHHYTRDKCSRLGCKGVDHEVLDLWDKHERLVSISSR
jgi:hypothetical protein